MSTLRIVLLVWTLALKSKAALIAAGTASTTVHSYLSAGSYLFGITVTLGADKFLLPVSITGAANLQ